MFRKVLIANRGEIAVRVIRTCREMGIRPVAVYSDADAGALHVRHAYQAVPIGPAPASESYLVMEKILAAAKQTEAEAIHPGYGFLSENAEFAQAVFDDGLVFIGPPAEAIRVMGDKLAARQTMHRAGVPIVPGTIEPVANAHDARTEADGVGYPVLLKAVAGGGGKGMRKVNTPDEIDDALERARGEAKAAFGDDRVYLEKMLTGGRHVEVQVLSDAQGNHLHLFERDCSLQRRHQKVLEESPCPVLEPEVAAQMYEVAVRAAAAVDYRGAGTVEFLLMPDGAFHFLEMNTRLQVEHPITEMITGIDLVRAQLLVAAGEDLGLQQQHIQRTGHAIECRVYAEDPNENFRPSPGRLHTMRTPGGAWVRVDSGVVAGSDVPIYYDPMIAKLAVWGSDRPAAIQRAVRALREFRITGVSTSIPFFLRMLHDPDVVAGNYDIATLEQNLEAWTEHRSDQQERVAMIAAAVSAFIRTESRSGVTHSSAGQGKSSPWWQSGLPGGGGR